MALFKKRKRHYHKRRKSFGVVRLKKQTVYTVAAIWMWLFAGTITLAFFGEGSLLTSLRDEITYHIGWGMYGLPPFLITASFLLFKVKSDIGKPNVPLGVGIMLASLIGLTQAGIAGEAVWNILAEELPRGGGFLVFLGVFGVGFFFPLNPSFDLFKTPSPAPSVEIA